MWPNGQGASGCAEILADIYGIDGEMMSTRGEGGGSKRPGFANMGGALQGVEKPGDLKDRLAICCLGNYDEAAW